ncbi:MAG: DUF2461 domain-containing protein [Ignavibacteria bacterium]|jgi:uncharacterized protein (TIGR02453 family)
MMFQGFDNKAFQFLKHLKNNNSREWFAENKSIYECALREPSKLLLNEIDQLFIKHRLPYEANPKKSLFRINRDTRFSKDKTPYKTNVGITFPIHRKQDHIVHATKTEKPGMYLHIEPGACFIAGGLYMPDGQQLKSIRERIESDWTILHKIQQQRAFKKEFPKGLLGEKLKTMPRGYDPEHPGKEYLRMKQFIVMESIPDSAVKSETLIKALLAKASAMSALIVFLDEAITD